MVLIKKWPSSKINGIISQGNGIRDRYAPQDASLTSYWVKTSARIMDRDASRTTASMTMQASASTEAVGHMCAVDIGNQGDPAGVVPPDVVAQMQQSLQPMDLQAIQGLDDSFPLLGCVLFNWPWLSGSGSSAPEVPAAGALPKAKAKAKTKAKAKAQAGVVPVAAKSFEEQKVELRRGLNLGNVGIFSLCEICVFEAMAWKRRWAYAPIWRWICQHPMLCGGPCSSTRPVLRKAWMSQDLRSDTVVDLLKWYIIFAMPQAEIHQIAWQPQGFPGRAFRVGGWTEMSFWII